jgi:hypothetical protein
MLERGGYQAALYLQALIVAVNGGAFLYSRWYLPQLEDGAAFYMIQPAAKPSVGPAICCTV